MPSVITLGSKHATNDLEQAELFSEYFASVYSPSSIPDIDPYCPPRLPVLKDCPLDEHDVSKVLLELDVSKAKGGDNLPPSLFKNVPNLARSFSQIFRNSMRIGTFPTAWKRAVITPIFKKGDKTLASNYRPVALLPQLSKVFERCLFVQLYEHLKGWFHSAQYGFRARRSPIVQLVKFLDGIYKKLDAGQVVDVVYTDFQSL